MESNDQVRKGNNDKTSKLSGKEGANASLNTENTGRSKTFRDETLVGVPGQVGQNQRVTEKEYSFGTEKQAPSERAGSKARVSENSTRNYNSEDSDNGFLSSVKFNKTTLLGLAGALAGGALIFKALKGKSSSKKAHEIQLQTRQTIKNSREELYAYWRNLENLPNFMSHIKEVREIDERRSKWTAEVPGGMGTVEWEALIEQDIVNSFISWRSVADADIRNAGEVRFEEAPNGKGTIVETTISYLPPAGNAGEYVAELLNPAFEKIVKKDLKQFKKHMEKGGAERSKKILY